MNKTKITNHQMFSLAANGAIAGSVLVVSSIVASISKQDSWIAALLAIVFGIPVIWIYWFLGSLYPGMSLVGIIKKIFGKWVGLAVSAGFAFSCINITSYVIWFIGDFITTQAMPEAPANVINLLFIIAIVIALLYGIETIARASEIFIYFASILFFTAMFLVSPNIKIENLQPVFEKGIIPILKSSVHLSCFITFPLITLMMIYPTNINNIPEAKKPLFKGQLLAGFMVFITILMSILVLGSAITAKSRYPTYLLTKKINIGNIFTRLEFIIITSWLFTQFMTCILYFYAGVKGLSELFRLKDHKRIVVPLGLIVFTLIGVNFPNVVYQIDWATFVWPPFIITNGLILPVLLLLIFFIKKWVFKRT